MSLDDFMVDFNGRDGNFRNSSMIIWLANILLFPRIGENKNGRCKEEIFLQYYEVLENDQLVEYYIDKSLVCLRVQLNRTIGIEGKNTASEQFGLLPIESSRGFVHIVPGDTEMGLLRILRGKQ